MSGKINAIIDSFSRYGDKHAFCFQDKFFTYKELEFEIAGLQQQLIGLELAPNSNIGVVTFNDVQTYAALLAVLFCGHAFVPIHPDHPAERNEAILNQAEISVILCSKVTAVSTGMFPKSIKIIDSAIAQTETNRVRLLNFQTTNNAYILFTSGSTGAPKGVPISISNLESFLNAFFKLGYVIDENDRFLQMFDLTFDLSIMSYLAPLCIGACVFTVPFDGIKYMHVYQLLEKYELTFTLMVPSIITHLRQYFDEIRLDKLRYSLFCGEALYEDVTVEWANCIPNAIIENVYGPTEATIFCTSYRITRDGSNKNLNGILSIGVPMDKVEILIVDKNLQPLTVGEKGELCLTGSQITPGYWKNPTKNSEAFFEYKSQRYYRTGDLCFIDEQGDIFYSGRIDFQVKIQGYRIELGEIEFHAREFIKSSAVAAVAVENEQNIWQIHLFIESDADNFDELMKYLKVHLPAYMIPNKISGMPLFPLNANGKIDRKALASSLNRPITSE